MKADIHLGKLGCLASSSYIFNLDGHPSMEGCLAAILGVESEILRASFFPPVPLPLESF